ncbi:Formamidopyrimidine-DNA glycosylase [Lathyrus oleraceus]|uniref:Formamidopyrimidine-DNA glycosylase n=1 Tax=Pisum sativum TaxID=3888 RepID=A0A9D4YEL4_PEA|nr:hypothetical protein KIW84_022533 [Pisum sativum]KAI5436120.1 Formamidopyrimidine-DNA glycosylase [Pisum sativum]
MIQKSSTVFLTPNLKLPSSAKPLSQLAGRARTCGFSSILRRFLSSNSLDDGLEISFTDKRRFAKVRLLKDPTSVPPISELGPDALFEPMTLDKFTGRLHKKKTEIKVLLLDQSYISGIGNWVADEVLYQARIHPQQSASSLSGENCSTLYECSKEVIEKAVEVETRNQVQHQPTPMATETHQRQNLRNQTEENSINIQQKTQLISNRKLTSDNPNATTTSLQQLFSRSPLNTPQAAATQHRMPAISMSATTLNRAPSHLQNQQYRAGILNDFRNSHPQQTSQPQQQVQTKPILTLNLNLSHSC